MLGDREGGASGASGQWSLDAMVHVCLSSGSGQNLTSVWGSGVC